ncbi:MAG: DUF4339 domain-containing protein [Gemmataceae bacterium]|nr:DUF4339 domain-containing protein [Gemmataceae bacterium]
MPNQWYIARDEKAPLGPYSDDQLHQLARQGKLTSEIQIGQAKDGPWFPASRIKGLFPESATPPPVPPAPSRGPHRATVRWVFSIVNKVAGATTILLGLVAGIMLFSAADIIYMHGVKLTALRSEGGNSIMEVYYQQVGGYGIGLAKLTSGVSAVVIAISFGLGVSQITRE